MNSKGMEMAIQIFIVLFVLLAVSMLVLQLVSQQFTSNQDQLVQQQREQAYQQQKKELQTTCSAFLSSGKPMDQAAYCMKKFSLAGDGSLVSSYIQDDFGLMGFCDDAIYCFIIDQKIKPNDCVPIICNYLKSLGVTKENATKTLQDGLVPGSCDYENEVMHWYNLGFSEEGLNCNAFYE